MSYPTEASPLADILEALTKGFDTNVRPLGYIVRGPHAGELCTILRVREYDLEVEIGMELGAGLRDAVAQDAVALLSPDWIDDDIAGKHQPAGASEPVHSTDPVLDDALQADAEKLRALGADPGPTFDELEAAHDPDLGHLGES